MSTASSRTAGSSATPTKSASGSNRTAHQAEPLYATATETAAAKGVPFTSASSSGGFNQGAEVDLSVTPKPWYALDGKSFRHFDDPGDSRWFEIEVGAFPFPPSWGPMAGAASTEWIADATAETIRNHSPTLTLAYLPHLDYKPQRRGPSGCEWRNK